MCRAGSKPERKTARRCLQLKGRPMELTAIPPCSDRAEGSWGAALLCWGIELMLINRMYASYAFAKLSIL